MSKSIGIMVLTGIFIFGIYATGHAAGFFEKAGEVFGLEEQDFKGVILGAGARYSPSPYRGQDDDVWPVPVIVGEYKRFYSDGPSLGYKLNDDEDLFLSAVLAPRLGGYESDDSTELNGMEDREWSLDGGLRLTWHNGYFDFNVTGLADLLNNHQGREVKAVFSREFFDGLITPRVGVKWTSEDTVDYYYGVLGNEATAGRSAYEGESTADFFAGLRLGVPLDDHWTVIGDFEYENLGSGITDSPLVDTDSFFTYVAGLAYRF